MNSKTALLATVFCASVSAQVTYGNGTFVCARSGGTYCAGASNTTNIIIRCNGTVGQPGNCNDNLAGEPPIGVNYSPCIESSPTAGDAACSKNGVVYPENGSSSTSSASMSPSLTALPYAATSHSFTPAPYVNETLSSMASSLSTSYSMSSLPASNTTMTLVTPCTWSSFLGVIATTSVPTMTISTSASASLSGYTGGAAEIRGNRMLGGVLAIVLGALAL